MAHKDLFTPVLLLAFNRPEHTKQAFDMIRGVRPQKLYVAVDAPRENHPEDQELCAKVKRIVQNVDWPCQVHYLFQEKNQGCSRSGYLAWDWLFQTEDRMIFIEDDCLASQSAFFFVQDMLERYKDDSRVAYVGAVNHKLQFGDKSYFFSRYPDSTYFMGTWKRVHCLLEYRMESFYETRHRDSYLKSYWGRTERWIQERKFQYYISRLDSEFPSNSYDIQMLFLSYKYNMYSIYPNINMVSDNGVESGANSSNKSDSPFVREYGHRQRYEMDEIRYCDDIVIDDAFERKHFRKRALLNQPAWKVWMKFFFLQYAGDFYDRYLKPIRQRLRVL